MGRAHHGFHPVENGAVTLKTRKGLDWTKKFTTIAEAGEALPDGIYDGEIVALDGNGAPDFASLQAAIADAATDDLVFFAFDLLVEGGTDWREEPLRARKARLAEILAASGSGDTSTLRYVDHFETGGDAVLKSACRLSASASARRVLPRPPGPVSVSRRVCPSRPSSSASSRPRPTKLVS